jgi:hypothetical protein
VSSTDSTGAPIRISSAAWAPVSAEGEGAADLLRRRIQRVNAAADATAGALHLNGPPSSLIPYDLSFREPPRQMNLPTESRPTRPIETRNHRTRRQTTAQVDRPTTLFIAVPSKPTAAATAVVPLIIRDTVSWDNGYISYRQITGPYKSIESGRHLPITHRLESIARSSNVKRV